MVGIMSLYTLRSGLSAKSYAYIHNCGVNPRWFKCVTIINDRL